jgi:hypothetical protein
LPVPGAGFTFSTPSTGAAVSSARAAAGPLFLVQLPKANTAIRQIEATTNLLSIAKKYLSF